VIWRCLQSEAAANRLTEVKFVIKWRAEYDYEMVIFCLEILDLEMLFMKFENCYLSSLQSIKDQAVVILLTHLCG
jgi:hypothetical protein